MKTLVVICCLAGAVGPTLAQDIVFNRIVTFTNLQGEVYSQVLLASADNYGLIWRKKATGGRVCYTNLSPAVLDDIGIPAEWIKMGSIRAAQKAKADAEYRAKLALEGQEAQELRLQAQRQASLRAFYQNQARAAQEAQREALLNSVPYAAASGQGYTGSPYDSYAPFQSGATPYSSWAYGWSPIFGWWATSTSSSTTMHNPWN